MGLLNWWRGKKTEQRDLTYEQGVRFGLIQDKTRSGVVVNRLTALGVSAVFCAVKVISEAGGSLPLIAYEKTPDGRRRAEEQELYTLLHDRPNPYQTRPVFWETFISNCLLVGNGIAEIQRYKNGSPAALWNLDPANLEIQIQSDGKPIYKVGNVELEPEDVLHVPGLSADGSVGYDLLKLARQSLGFTIATDRWGQTYFGNASRPSGTINMPSGVSEKAKANMRDSWQKTYGGIDNVGRTPVLEEGTTFTPFNLSNEAGQYDETRRFQITEVSRLFNITPVKLHELGRATWANLSVLNTDFYTTTLRPWLEKIEAEIERKLLTEDERKTYYVEFLADSILRGDTAGRYANYRIANPTAVWLTPAEIREFENMPPLPDQTEDDLSDEGTDDTDDMPETDQETGDTAENPPATETDGN